MNEYVAGSTSIVEVIFLQSSSSTTGGGLTGLAYNTSGLTCYYKRSSGTASVAVSLATIATLGTYTSGGFAAIDGTNMPGCYEFHPPNAAFASGATEVTFFFQGAAGLVSRPIKYRIYGGINPDDAIRAGLTAFPNVATGNAGAVLVDGTGTAAISNSSGKVILQATQTGVTIPTITNVTNAVTVTGTPAVNATQLAGQTVTAAAGVTFPTTVASPTNITAGTITTVTNLTNAATTGDLTAAMKASVTTAATAATPTAAAVTGAVGGIAGTTQTLDALQTALNSTHGAGSWITATGFATPTNITAGVITTVTNLTNAPTAGDFTAAMKTSLNAATPASIQSVTNIVSGGAITTSSGKVSEVALVDTLTTYTGNTPQTGDSYARLGATGSGLTSLAPAATALSTATWTNALAGYLTGPVATASGLTAVQTHGDSAWATATGFATPTNITGGTITTVTNLTNAPGNGDFTATMKASLGTVVGVAQTGDSYARIGATGSGLTSLAPAATALSSATWTNTLAGYITGPVATASGLTAMQTHGDSTWATAVGFATSVALAALQTHGDSTWATATGFATAAALAAVQTHGDSTWATATGFALASSWTAQRAGYLDNISAGPVALEAEAVLIYNAVAALGTPQQAGSAVTLPTVAGVSFVNAVRYIGAAVAGKASGVGSGVETYDDYSGALAFVVALDTNNNRTNFTYS
jgi:hypothetical protein